MDLLPVHSSMDLIVSQQSPHSSFVDSEKILQQSIEKRDQEQRNEVWEKLPHGGPYRKIPEKQADKQLGSHTRPEDHWGYEKVKVGPTTNFVGDIMSSTAVDLVRAELKASGSDGMSSERECLLPRPPRVPEPVNGGAESLIRRMTRDLINRLESGKNRRV